MKNPFCEDEKKDVISYVSAIANMEGGDLVLGVHDSSWEIVGQTHTITTNGMSFPNFG